MIDLAKLQEKWEAKLEPRFPLPQGRPDSCPRWSYDCPANKRVAPAVRLATPAGALSRSSPAPTASMIPPAPSASAGGDPHILVLKQPDPRRCCRELSKPWSKSWTRRRS